MAVAALALIAALLQPTGRAQAEAVFTFEGGGFGHSVGMSQFGAYGMALDGYSWQDILTHYYTGTTVQEADPRFTDPPLWVGLTQERTRVDLLVRAVGAPSAPVVVTRNDKTLTAGAGDTITIEHLGDGRCRVTTPSGSLTGGCSMTLEWDGWEDSPTTALQQQGCTLPDWNAPGGTVYKPCTYARGTLHVNPDNNTQSVNLSLEIDIEDYVLGISESPYGWGSTGGMASLQAQAVAARSYAIHRAVDRGDPASRPWCYCHVYDTPVDQNYVGWGHGTQNWIDAVTSTAGMVVTHPSETSGGALLPIEAFYSSSTFGWTEHSEHGFTQFVPYLRAVDDHWSLDPRVYNHSGRWTRQFSASTLASKLPGMSTVTGLQVTECSTSGAALKITFSGSGGPRTYTTRELRGYLGLRSMQVVRAGSPLPDEPACPQPGDGGGGPAEGGPVVLAGLTIDDDNAGDSFGNGDGVAQCGEVVEVFTTIRNEGARIEGVAATLVSNDPFVSIRWNTTSTFPDLAAGAAAANHGDWDLTIAPDAPSHHTAVLSMEVLSDGAGPWTVEVPLPITCGGTDSAGTIGIPDVDGNGTPEVVVAVRTPKGKWLLKARDAATGEVVGRVRVAAPAWEIHDLAPVPGAPSSVAVLMNGGRRGITRVVVADLATGSRTAQIKYGPNREPIALSVLPGADQIAYAALVRFDDRVTRLEVRAADGTRLTKQGTRLDPIDMVALDDVGGGPAADVAVLGVLDGRATVFVLDSGDGSRVAAAVLGTAPAVAAAALRTLPDGPLDAVAVLQEGLGDSSITVASARNGAVLATLVVPVARPVDLEALPPFGGQGPAVAVLGIAPDGVPTAIVADLQRLRLLSGPVFDAGMQPVDLTVLDGFGPSSAALASLGTSSTASSIELRDAASGAPLGSLRVP